MPSQNRMNILIILNNVAAQDETIYMKLN